jgi:hypothetical protein
MPCAIKSAPVSTPEGYSKTDQRESVRQTFFVSPLIAIARRGVMRFRRSQKNGCKKS